MGISGKLRRLAFTTALAAAGVIGMAASAPGARADIIWTFNDVPFDDGGSLTGSFTLNNFGMLTTWNIATQGGDSGVTAYDYTPGLFNASINLTRDQVVFLRSGPLAGNGGLQLTFMNPLTISSSDDPMVDGVGGPSLECGSWSCAAGPTRYVGEGFAIDAVSAIPEPATWTMMLLGLGAVGYMVRRRALPALMSSAKA